MSIEAGSTPVHPALVGPAETSLGDKVGAIVGEGAGVGDKVGAIVGEGAGVGDAVGDGVGTAVGDRVGAAVGGAEGTAVGCGVAPGTGAKVRGIGVGCGGSTWNRSKSWRQSWNRR